MVKDNLDVLIVPNQIFVPNTNNPLTLSQSAHQRIMQIKQENKDLFLTVKVTSGGCAGFQTHFDFNDQLNDNDCQILCNKQIYATIDALTSNMLQGAVIDYVSKFGGSFFTIKKLDSKDSCSCGTSFSI